MYPRKQVLNHNKQSLLTDNFNQKYPFLHPHNFKISSLQLPQKIMMFKVIIRHQYNVFAI